MNAHPTGLRSIASLCIAALTAVGAARAAPSAEELAKLAQNPIANLISVPFQNNTNVNVGPDSGTQNILNIQPVVPVSLGADWNLITRTIFPVITQAGVAPVYGALVNNLWSVGAGDDLSCNQRLAGTVPDAVHVSEMTGLR